MFGFRSSKLQLVSAADLFLTVASQIFTFDNAPAPTGGTLTSRLAPSTTSVTRFYDFYVYERHDASVDASRLPKVSFEDFLVRCDDAIYRDGACPYPGIQVVLITSADFQAIFPEHFCCGDDDAEDVGCTANNLLLQNVSSQPGFDFKPIYIPNHHSDAYVYTVMGQERVYHEAVIGRTGVYTLMLSNCGYEDSVKLSGRVVVRNSYGFLPGNEFPRKAFNGWFAVIHFALLCAWALLMGAWRQDLFTIHWCFAAVVVAATARSVSWWVFLRDWNNVGIRSDNLLAGVMLIEGLHVALSTFLLLSASFGWGITLGVLRWQLLAKLVTVCSIYGATTSAMLYDFSEFELMTSAQVVSPSLLLLGCIQVALNLGITCVVCKALSRHTQALADPRHMAKLRLFLRLRRILCLSALSLIASGVLQGLDLTRSSRTSWQVEWFWKDGLPRTLEAFNTVLMMYLWAPCSYRKHYKPEQPEAQVFLAHDMTALPSLSFHEAWVFLSREAQQTELTHQGDGPRPLVI